MKALPAVGQISDEKIIGGQVSGLFDSGDGERAHERRREHAVPGSGEDESPVNVLREDIDETAGKPKGGQPQTGGHTRIFAPHNIFDPAAIAEVLTADPSCIRVSPELFPRVFAVSRGLARHVERRGYRLGMSTKNPKAAFHILIGTRQWGVELAEERELTDPPPPRPLFRPHGGPPRRKLRPPVNYMIRHEETHDGPDSGDRVVNTVFTSARLKIILGRSKDPSP
ncbi:hypothetical protein [Streptosporangium sp. LJ11]|uniref:hypothetical protein n=1 Tax=Streptosporangium sp. LJ11 TaxID=3436927 RepID=UPI003F78E841